MDGLDFWMQIKKELGYEFDVEIQYEDNKKYYVIKNVTRTRPQPCCLWVDGEEQGPIPEEVSCQN